MANGTSRTKGSNSTSQSSSSVNPPNNLPQIGEQPELVGSEKVQWAKSNTNLPENQVADIIDSVGHFTGSGYSGIRNAQKGTATNPQWLKEGQDCENFITNAPQWNNSSPLYRGISLKDESFIANLKVGDNFDVNGGGSASWSTKKKVSEDFATAASGTPVLVQCDKSTNAAPIMHLSHFHHEYEVLCSKNNQYRVVSKTKTKIHGHDGYLVKVEQIK